MNTLALLPTEGPNQRRVFAILLALVWLAMISGFGLDSAQHIAKHGLDYPWIVHVHAMVFIAWLVLFTVQITLIRRRKIASHRRLGKIGAVLALVMIVLGLITALVVAAHNYAVNGETPEFLAVEFTDLAVFGGFTGAAIALRRHLPTHKRLMLLGLFYLSAPGFARAINGVLIGVITAIIPITAHPVLQFLHIFTGPDLLILALGLYDLAAYRRLHRSYIVGVLVIAVAECLAIYLLNDPNWLELSLTLIGQ